MKHPEICEESRCLESFKPPDSKDSNLCLPAAALEAPLLILSLTDPYIPHIHLGRNQQAFARGNVSSPDCWLFRLSLNCTKCWKPALNCHTNLSECSSTFSQFPCNHFFYFNHDYHLNKHTLEARTQALVHHVEFQLHYRFGLSHKCVFLSWLSTEKPHTWGSGWSCCATEAAWKNEHRWDPVFVFLTEADFISRYLRALQKHMNLKEKLQKMRRSCKWITWDGN